MPNDPRKTALGLLALMLTACGSGDETGGPDEHGPCGAGEVTHPAGGCCPAGTTAHDDGSCRPAGVPPDQCAPGFVADGEDGCVAVLPAEPCADGWMALPGEDTCREVAPCGDGVWGDIPVEATTQHVDAAYAGGSSDGSAERPWTRIQQGVVAAAPGAIVAIAAGQYVEHVLVEDKAVRLWGRCPSLVEIVGVATDPSTVLVLPGADGTEVRDLAIRGPQAGLLMSGVHDVLAARLWLHDLGSRGIDVEDTLGTTSATVRDTLVERSRVLGFYVGASELLIERSVIRDIRSAPGGSGGRGFSIEPLPGDPKRSNVTVRGSLFDGCREAGGLAHGSDVVLADTIIRQTQPSDLGAGGVGLAFITDEQTGFLPGAALSRVVIEDSREIGLWLDGAAVSMEYSVVRRTTANSEGNHGRGMAVQQDFTTLEPTRLQMQSSLVEDNQELGIFVGGSEATFTEVAVRATTFDTTALKGMGIALMPGMGQLPARLVLRGSEIVGSHAFGIQVYGSELLMERTLVSEVHPGGADTFGDGISVASEPDLPGSAELADSLVARGARAGSSNFGSTVGLRNVRFDCNTIQLNGESSYTMLGVTQALPFSYADHGGNVCGCGDQLEPCAARSTGLAPPEPVGSGEPL